MSDLPSDPALLRQTVMALSSRLAALSEECSTLATERDAAIAQRDAAIQENDKLLMILSQYKRTIFGPRSETLDIGQLSLRRQSSPLDQFDGKASGTSCASLASS